MTTRTAALRILFADDDPDSRAHFEELLTRLGHKVFTVASGQELIDVTAKAEPDLIISDIIMPGVNGIQAVKEISRSHRIPVILVSAHHDDALLSQVGTDHIMSYLVKPVREADVRVAISVAMTRFRQFQVLTKEATDLRQALEDRKVLERAKGAVMKRLRVEEEDAFRRMKKLASNTNRKLVEVAHEILRAEQVFHDLEQP